MRDYSKPRQVFILAGLSESGKSYAGMFFDKRGVKRLKYVKLFAREQLKENPEINPYKLLEQSDLPEEEQVQRAVRSLKDICESEDIPYCSIESMVKPSTAIALKKAIGEDKVKIIYFEIDEEIRLHRQMERESVDYEVAKRIMLPRDQKKIIFGTTKIKEIADIVIDNSGTKDDLNQKLLKLIDKYCR